MFRIPGSLKIRGGVTKILLREAMKGILPEETRTRIKKTGWNAPAHTWFSQGSSAEELGDLIESRVFKESNIYNINIIRKLFKEHTDIVKGNVVIENHMMFFWQLINNFEWIKSINKI
jgi:asparagine synthase (glutamine-hydrolysing)